MDLLHDLFFDYTLRTVALGALLLGAVAGALGAFALLRRQSLLGDAVSHAALPGVALAFLLTGSKAAPILLLGAAVVGTTGAVLVTAIVRTTRLPVDTALAMMLSVFFGVGLVLLTFVQRQGDATQAGLDRFLFGQAAAIVGSDLLTMGAVGGAALLAVVLFWKHWKILTFDPGFAASLGLPVRLLDVGLTWLVVLAIVIGLQTVGVVLMSALLVAPAAAARQWTERLGVMVLLSGLFGGLAGVVGAVLSSVTERLPTGPTVVLVAVGWVGVSLLVAPARGLLPRRLAAARNRASVRAEAVLAQLAALAEHHEDRHHPHAEPLLRCGQAGFADVRPALESLAARGLVRRAENDCWSVTDEGLRHLAARGDATAHRENGREVRP